MDDSDERIVTHVRDVVNYLNEIYAQLNVKVVLSHIEVWRSDPVQLSKVINSVSEAAQKSLHFHLRTDLATQQVELTSGHADALEVDT